MGWVYVLMNPSMIGIYKVGMTERSPEERANELSKSTSVATPFFVIYKHQTHYPKELEYEVHKELENTDSRVNSNREFFNGDPSIAIRIIIRLAKELNPAETAVPNRVESNSWVNFEREAFEYLNGEGDKLEDTLKAAELFRKAKKLGSKKSSLELIKLEDNESWAKTDESLNILSTLREAGEIEASYLLFKHYDYVGLISNSIKLAKEILSNSDSVESKLVEECTFYLAEIAIRRCPNYGYKTILTEISLEESESIIQFLKAYQEELISFYNKRLKALGADVSRIDLQYGVFRELGILSTLGDLYSNEILKNMGYNLTKEQIKEIQTDDYCDKAEEIYTDLLERLRI